MKILVSVDIEGIAGVVHPDQTRPGQSRVRARAPPDDGRGERRDRGRSTGGHGGAGQRFARAPFATSCPTSSIRAPKLLLGKPRDLGMMAGVDQDCTAVFLVGWHARASAAGVLAHTINSFAFARVWVNGAETGEAGLYGAVAGEFGVPVALFTGDDAFVAETAPLFPGAIGVAVKRAHG